jgi:UDP-N-acetylmuramyl pentapeptide phosphotransferase/UDP-N-acetylglucosamine-1-phosphate transferase
MFVGFVDDARQLDAKFKFAVYAILAIAAAWLLGVVDQLRVGDHTLTLPFGVGLLGTALWVFTLVNAANFMDGANGVAMGSVAVGLVFTSIIALEDGSVEAAAIGLCGAAALAGFLVWNFPSGRLFAGDSGALFAGALAAFACLILITRTGLSPFLAPVLFFPILADVLLTLFDRVRRRRSLFVGHDEHIYQITIKSGWSHARIALVYWFAMTVCGVIAFLADRDATETAPAIALAILAIAAIAIDFAVRRSAKARGILHA